jgi:hypothetical protein
MKIIGLLVRKTYVACLLQDQEYAKAPLSDVNYFFTAGLGGVRAAVANPGRTWIRW